MVERITFNGRNFTVKTSLLDGKQIRVYDLAEVDPVGPSRLRLISAFREDYRFSEWVKAHVSICRRPVKA